MEPLLFLHVKTCILSPSFVVLAAQITRLTDCEFGTVQALREIEARSGVTFLHSSSCNRISKMFDASPEDGLLSKVEQDSHVEGTSCTTRLWPFHGVKEEVHGGFVFPSGDDLRRQTVCTYQRDLTCQSACQASSPLVTKRGFDIAAS